jgi:hypothetical protein
LSPVARVDEFENRYSLFFRGARPETRTETHPAAISSGASGPIGSYQRAIQFKAPANVNATRRGSPGAIVVQHAFLNHSADREVGFAL